MTCAPHHVARRRYGRGTKPDWQRAGEVYAKATLGQAFFNLGYMHQYGAGLPQVGLPKPLKPAGPKLRALVAHWGRHVHELLCVTPNFETERAGGWRCCACGAFTELAPFKLWNDSRVAGCGRGGRSLSRKQTLDCCRKKPSTACTWRCCDKAAAAVACCGRKVEFF